jgi:hypothetical protein
MDKLFIFSFPWEPQVNGGKKCVEKKKSRLETQGIIEYAIKYFPYNNQINLNKSLGHG